MALVLAALDLIGLAIASYLTISELPKGGVPQCGPLPGCQEVARSEYSHLFGVPVAFFGVILSITLFILAIWWWRTNSYKVLLTHYLLSLVGVIFELYFQYRQFFDIHAFCIWCESYGISLVLRFLIAFWVFIKTPKPEPDLADDSA